MRSQKLLAYYQRQAVRKVLIWFCYDDQWSLNLGVGQRFSPKWLGSVSVGWDSGAGDKVSTVAQPRILQLGLAQYSPTSQYFISVGVKYYWLGDAKAQLAQAVVTIM